ncbi:MAG: protein kinase [Acidobacteria bacterium]|nr:protein kinase [Acidobacteriota bacterium]
MQLPALFGKYELEKFLGGGMSHVFKARDTVLGRTVAVKILTEEGCRDEDVRKRFLAEARMCGNIVHDNIIRIHDYGELDGRPYIVMEFLVGEDLRTAIEKQHTGDLGQKLAIALQAARAIHHVHSLNIIHRDLKPENLHVDTTDRVRLMDFGIAKAPNLHLTREGFAIGTPYYMAPEQVLGKPVTPAADIYGFGIVLYELMTGLKPVSSETVESLFYMILHQPLNLEPLEQAGVPQELISLISRCTAKKPEERPANFDAIIAELEAWQKRVDGGVAPAPAQARPPAPPSQQTPKRNWLPYAAGAGMLLATAAVAVMFLLPGGKTKVEPAKKGEPPKVEPRKAEPEPVLTDKSGAMMVLVPAGPFLSGDPGTAPKTEAVDAFYLDRTEVTVGAWNQFCQKEGCRVENLPADQPVTDVTYWQAEDYCRSLGKRLPKALEWEKAARGTNGFIFPWGNHRDPQLANVADNPGVPRNQLQPAASMENGKSPFQVLHMAGNAWEWVNERRAPGERSLAEFRKKMKPAPAADDSWFSVHGGGYDAPLDFAVAYEYITTPATYRQKSIGFRCAMDVPRP